MFSTFTNILSINIGATMYTTMLILTACGCFLVGVNLMSKGFLHLSSKGNSFFIKAFHSRSRFGAIGGGLIHAAVTQSSDSTTVFTIRLIDIGAITLFQACCVIIGANIGTTLTTFVVSLSSLNLTPYFSFCAFIGAIPLLSSKPKLKIFGEIVGGFGILFIGLSLLSTNMQDASFRETVQTLFNFTRSGALLVLLGCLITMLVQSSSVVTSLVVSFVSVSLLPLDSAFFLVMGANVGTSVTSWFASLGGSANARRTSLFHTFYNSIGVLVMFVIFKTIRAEFMGVAEGLKIASEFKVALFHLVFNLLTAFVVVPLARPLAYICKKVIRH